MTDEEVELSPALPTPAFAAHLDRFRRSTSTSSPTSSRSTPTEALPSRSTAAGSAETSSGLERSPAKSTSQRVRSVRLTPPRARGTAAPAPCPDCTSSHFKRKAANNVEPIVESSASTPTKRKKKPPRPYAHPSQYAELGDDPLPDYLREGLDVLLCGINPGVKSAQMRLHCEFGESMPTAAPITDSFIRKDASPTNHFWKCLAGAGFTDGLLHPSQGPTLPTVGVGSTNLVQRPSAEVRTRAPIVLVISKVTLQACPDERDFDGRDA